MHFATEKRSCQQCRMHPAEGLARDLPALGQDSQPAHFLGELAEPGLLELRALAAARTEGELQTKPPWGGFRLSNKARLC